MKLHRHGHGPVAAMAGPRRSKQELRSSAAAVLVLGPGGRQRKGRESKVQDRAQDLADSAGAGTRVRKRATLADDLYEQILRRILSGEYVENSKLPTEAELAASYGVSRPVVREALSKLRDDGIILSRQGSGSYVKHKPGEAMLRFAPIASIADIQRCFEFRSPVESEAAAVAAERRDKTSLEDIGSALKSLDRSIRSGQVGVDSDYAFHLAIAKATKNRFYVATMTTLRDHIVFGMNLTRNLSRLYTTERLERVQAEHVEVYEAIKARNAEAARNAMRAHIAGARRRIFEDSNEGSAMEPALPAVGGLAR